MKITLLAITTLFSLSINAQDQAYLPQSGDKELDKELTTINTKATADIETFKSELETNLGLPKEKAEVLLTTMKPADVYMVAQTSQTTGKSVDEVATVYEKNKGKGWGVTAKELGIKPGSKEFKDLKGKAKNQGKGKSKGKGKEKSEEKTKKNDKEKSEVKEKSEEKAKEKSGGKGKGKK